MSVSRKYGKRQKVRGREGEREVVAKSPCPLLLDNPFCQDENYPALIHNYFPPSVSISDRRCNKLIYTTCIFSPAVFMRLIIFYLVLKVLGSWIIVCTYASKVVAPFSPARKMQWRGGKKSKMSRWSRARVFLYNIKVIIGWFLLLDKVFMLS